MKFDQTAFAKAGIIGSDKHLTRIYYQHQEWPEASVREEPGDFDADGNWHSIEEVQTIKTTKNVLLEKVDHFLFMTPQLETVSWGQWGRVINQSPVVPERTKLDLHQQTVTWTIDVQVDEYWAQYQNLKFNYPYPNRSYIGVYTTANRVRTPGVFLRIPDVSQLKNADATLNLIETYQIETAIGSGLKFRRRLELPIFAQNSQVECLPQAAEKLPYTLLIRKGQHIDWPVTRDLSKRIIMLNSDCVPRLYLDCAGGVVYQSYAGSIEELNKGLAEYKVKGQPLTWANLIGTNEEAANRLTGTDYQNIVAANFGLNSPAQLNSSVYRVLGLAGDNDCGIAGTDDDYFEGEPVLRIIDTDFTNELLPLLPAKTK